MRRKIYILQFDGPDSTVTRHFLKIIAYMKWTPTPRKRKALNVNTI